MPGKKQPGRSIGDGPAAFSKQQNPGGGSKVPSNQRASGNTKAHQPAPATKRVPDWKT
jgi:hypothetical protein